MRCFNHQDVQAIGTCKACHKGLCPECANDLGHGLACAGKHEEVVETYNTIIQRNARVYSAAPKNILIAPIFYLFMGLVFAYFGYKDGSMTNLPFIMGAGFIVFGIVIFVRNYSLFKSNSKN
ncbi:hypothetical protein [Limnobaculum xujianqingii]|uniref:hypothetical protein n=1 Tax=Limnobaculum xujianqingii TaxID=2738837 RepID=UPI001126B77F|nr:hypothetical protein [Limnobaculum xujianqingii]